MGASGTRQADTPQRADSTQAMPSGLPCHTGIQATPDETTDFVERVETTDAPVEETGETTDAADDTERGLGGEDPGDRRVFFIGIGGASCSGKSTLAQRLAAGLNSPLNPVPLDGYFEPSRMPRHPKFGLNWETPAGVDFPKLLQDLHLIEKTMSSTEVVPSSLVIKANPGRGGGNMIRKGMANRRLEPGAPVIVVVEGFLLFHETDVSAMFDCTLWVQADCATCCARRHRRDEPGTATAKYQEWFEGLVWSHYEMYQARQLSNADGALKLDALRAEASLQEEAVAYCRARLSLR